MSTVIDEPNPAAPVKSRRRWWLAWELVAVAIVVAVALPFIGSFSTDVTAAAASSAALAIEQVPPAEHHDHGHEVTGADKVICGVHVFGFEPASAGSVDEIKTVYGYYFCAVGLPGTPYNESGRSDGPVVVQLGAQPVVVIAAPGDGYAERVRVMMPDQYEEKCFRGLPDSSIAAGVRDRFLAEVTG